MIELKKQLEELTKEELIEVIEQLIKDNNDMFNYIESLLTLRDN